MPTTPRQTPNEDEYETKVPKKYDEVWFVSQSWFAGIVARLSTLGSLQFSFGADFLELAMRYSNFKRIFQGCQLQLGKRLGYF